MKLKEFEKKRWIKKRKRKKRKIGLTNKKIASPV